MSIPKLLSMEPKLPKKTASEDTLEVLSSTLTCPICGCKNGMVVTECTLYRTDKIDKEYRKRREILAKCEFCEEEGRGDVKIHITQRF